MVWAGGGTGRGGRVGAGLAWRKDLMGTSWELTQLGADGTRIVWARVSPRVVPAGSSSPHDWTCQLGPFLYGQEPTRDAARRAVEQVLRRVLQGMIAPLSAGTVQVEEE